MTAWTSFSSDDRDTGVMRGPDTNPDAEADLPKRRAAACCTQHETLPAGEPTWPASANCYGGAVIRFGDRAFG